MANVGHSESAKAWFKARDVLLEEIETARTRETALDAGLARIEADFDGPVPNPAAWLAAQPWPVKTYWKEPGGALEMAGVGVADVIEADYRGGVPCYDRLFDTLERRLTDTHPQTLCYYGTIRFPSSSREDTPWKVFGEYRLLIPRIELLCCEGRVRVACNLNTLTGREFDTEKRDARDALDMVNPETAGLAHDLPAPACRVDLPGKDEWHAMVESAKRLFEQGKVEKVVLARETRLTFDSLPNPLSLVDASSRDDSQTYAFYFQPEAGKAFLGLSPERLYERRSTYLRSQALAGTCPRGGTSAADADLGNALLNSDKDRREFGIVATSLHGIFEKICRVFRSDHDASLLRLPHCQHLCSSIEGILADPMSDAELIEALHPTPAVGGHPRDTALSLIEQLEPFDRGLYAGPVGWAGYDAAEFAVAIRSVLVAGNTMSVFAGAGLVAGSDPDGEWNELENKIRGVLQGFGQP